jgi:hypothetical protein
LNYQSSDYRYCYDIHNILCIQSTHRLPELGYFRVASLSAPADITVSTSKAAGASDLHRSVHYEDGLGRLGFDITLNYHRAGPIAVTISPLIALSPHVLYTNVIEPLLRWTFVQRGYVLIHAACLSFNGKAVLVTAKTDTGKTSTIILTAKYSPACQFLSDDMTILASDGTVMSYPKPMTISYHTLNAAKTAPLPLLNRMALQVQSRLHSKSGRKVGLKLGTSAFPAASLNALVQMLIPPPKYMMDRLVPGVKFAKKAQLTHAVVIERGPDAEMPISHDDIVAELAINAEDAYGFPPYPIIGHQLYTWDGEDLHARERAIVSAALRGCRAELLRSASFGWWQRIPEIVHQFSASEPSIPTPLAPSLETPRPQEVFAN